MIDIGRKIARNTIYFTTGKVLGDLCAFIFLVYFARIFGAETLGSYTYSMAFAGLLSIFISMGMNICVAREVSKNIQDDLRYFSNALLTQAMLAIVVWSLIIAIALLLNDDRTTAMILICLGLYQVLYRLTMLFYTQFKVHEEMLYPALLELSHKLIILIVGGLLIWLTGDPLLALATYPLGAFLMLMLAAAISTNRYGRLVVKPDISFIRNLIRRSFPFFLLLGLTVLLDRVGIIILAILQGEFDTGIYAASDRLVVTMLQPVAIFGGIILPVLSRFSETDKDKLVKLYTTSIKLVIGILLPVSTFLFLLAEEIILIVYGDKYSEAVDVLKILAWLLLVSGISVVASTMMMAINQEKSLLKARFLFVGGYIGVCLIVIPIYSYIGLSIAKIIVFSVTAVFCLYYLRSYLSLSGFWQSIRAPLVSCLVAGVIFTLMTDVNIWLRAILFLASYFIVMQLLGALKLKDLNYLMRVLLGQNGT